MSRPLPSRLLACAALAALPGFLRADQLAVAPPARNWSMNLFSPEGFHTMNLGGAEVRPGPMGSDRLDVVDMNIIVFTGDAAARVDTILTSPAATFLVNERTAHGDQTVRLIRDDSEVTGLGWVYLGAEKKVLILHHARVTFQAAIPDLLK